LVDPGYKPIEPGTTFGSRRTTRNARAPFLPGWLRWLFGGFGRLGRGVELAAAGVLVSGAVMTWHVADPFAVRAEPAEQPPAHTCCCRHGAAAGPAPAQAAPGSHCLRDDVLAAPASEEPRTRGDEADASGRHGERGEMGPDLRSRDGGSVVTL
jgi:hypothetical protein